MGEIRTTPSGSVGVAELYHNVSVAGELMWNGICVSENEDNNLRVARTFCTQLGYGSASSYTSRYVGNHAHNNSGDHSFDMHKVDTNICLECNVRCRARAKYKYIPH